MMKNSFKILVLPLLLLFSFSNVNWGQSDPVIEFSGKISSSAGAKMSGVVVTVKRDGAVVKSETTASNGKFGPIEVPMGYTYLITYAKNGFITKTVKIDAQTGYFAEEVEVTSKLDLSPSMVEKKPDVDYSPITTKPIMEVNINPQEGGLAINSGYTNQQINKFDKFIKDLDDKANEDEKKFNDLVKAADEKAASDNYAGAVADYTAAMAIKADAGVTNKITEAKSKMKSKADFDKLIADGDQFVSSADFDGGIAKFEQAKQLFPANKAVIAKIKDANDKKTAAAAAQLKKEFDAKILEAKAAFDTKDYAFAQKKYEEASVLIPSEQLPKTKIAEIKKLIQDQFALEQKYATLITEGDKAMLEESYDLAIEKFTEALVIKKESHPETELAKATKMKQDAEDDANAKKAAQDKFDQLIAAGSGALSSKDLDGAESKFKEALNLDIDNPKAEAELAKVTAARQALDAENTAKEAAAKKVEFEAKIKSGDTKLTAKDFESSIAEYQSALEMGVDDVKANAKLDAVRAAKKEAEEAEDAALAEMAKLEAFSALIAAGKASYDAADYNGSISKYEDALAMGIDDPIAQDGLNLAKDALAQLERDKEKAEVDAKKAAFDKLIGEGDTELSSEGFDAAIAKYTSAKVMDVDNALADQKITAANNAKKAKEESSNLAAELEAKKLAFEKLIGEGDTKVGSESFDDAVAKFTEALNLDYNNGLAQGKIDAALAAKKAAEDAALAAAEAEKKNQFDELIANGDSKQTTEDFDGAISQFQGALDLGYDNPTAQAKMEAAKAAKKKSQADLEGEEKAAAEAAKKVDFEALIGAGDGKLTSEDFAGAISDYTSALNLDYDNPTAQAKVDAAKAAKAAFDAKFASEQSAAESAANKAKYDAFIAAGDAGLTAESFDVAIGEYESALATGVNDTAAQAKLAAAKAAKKKYEDDIANADANAALAEKKAEFTRLITEGSLKLGDNDFDGAISSFNGALGVDYDNPKAQEMINSAKQAKEDFTESQKENGAENALAEFNALIAQGDVARDSEDYETATDLYKQANVKVPTSPIPQERIDGMKELKAAQTQNEEGKALFLKLMGVVENLTQEEEYKKAKALLEKNKPLYRLKSAEIDEGIVKLDQLIADQEKEAAKEAEYKILIDQADAAFEKADWDASEKDYIKALSVYDRTYPKDQLKLIAENKASAAVADVVNKEDAQLRKDYEAQMAKGAANFGKEEYETALTNYKAAKNLIPEETEPQVQIDKINKILKDLAASGTEDLVYTNALAKADAKRDDALKSGKDISDIEALRIAVAQGGAAKDLYTAANALNSTDSYPQEQVNLINEKIAFWSQTIGEMESYNKIIAKADELFEAKNLDGAEELYTRAQGFKEEDPYPPAQLARIKALRNKGDDTDKFNDYITEGDDLFNKEEYDPAQKIYELAKDIVPESRYPDEKINQIKEIRAEELEKKRLEREKERQDLAANSVPDRERIDPMNLNEIRDLFRNQQEGTFSEKDNNVEDYKKTHDKILANDVDAQIVKSDATNDTYTEFQTKKSGEEAGFDDRRTEKLPDIKNLKDAEMNKSSDLTTDQTSRTNVTSETYADLTTERFKTEIEKDVRRTNTLDDFDSFEGSQREVSDKYNSGEQIRTEATDLYNTKAERKSEKLANYLDENRQRDVAVVDAYKSEQSEIGESRVERSTDNTYATYEAKEKMIAGFEAAASDQDKTRADKTIPGMELYKKSQSEELSQLTDQGTNSTYETNDQYAKLEKDISDYTNTLDEGRKENTVLVDAYKLSESQKKSDEINSNMDRTQAIYESNDSMKNKISEQFVDSDKTRDGNVDKYNSYEDEQSKANGSSYEEHVDGGVDKSNNLNEVKSQKATMFSDAVVDPLVAKYGQGIHEETFQRTSASGEVLEITVQRVVVEGNNADTYKMVSKKWGTNYFKNGAIIPQTTWDTDTN
jgi:tetratricopeptide (TPR) repeat protein